MTFICRQRYRDSFSRTITWLGRIIHALVQLSTQRVELKTNNWRRAWNAAAKGQRAGLGGRVLPFANLRDRFCQFWWGIHLEEGYIHHQPLLRQYHFNVYPILLLCFKVNVFTAWRHVSYGHCVCLSVRLSVCLSVCLPVCQKPVLYQNG